ncbi:MAG: DUF1559 domain-containing protein [Pirellulaceae bacterium]
MVRFRVPVYFCPSDPKGDELRDTSSTGSTSGIYLYPTTYGFNAGTWFVYDPRTNQGGDRITYPNANMKIGSITDMYQQYVIGCRGACLVSLYCNGGPPSTSVPLTVDDALAMIGSGKPDRLLASGFGTGHTEWANGHTHHSCFTTTFPPNTRIPYVYNGITYNCDYNSQQEGNSLSRPSYAIVTARSFHRGVVNAVWADGSVRATSENIDGIVWRASGTRNGGEVVALE